MGTKSLGPSWEITTKESARPTVAASGGGGTASPRAASYPVGECPPGSLLPPQPLPYAFEMRYEPERFFEAFNGAMAESQSISYLMHPRSGRWRASAETRCGTTDFG